MAANRYTDQSGDADRWYYNATIVNEDDSAPQPARFSEQRLVPLVNDCSEYYVALARLSVLGVTSNFPILRPSVSIPATNASPVAVSNYVVALRWIAFAYASVAGQVTNQLTPVGFSNLSTAPLLFPKETIVGDPEASSDVYSVRVVEDALSAALQTAYSNPFVNMTYVPAVQGMTLFPPIADMPTLLLDPPVTATTEEGTRFLQARIDTSSYKLSLLAPVQDVLVTAAGVETVELRNPFITPCPGTLVSLPRLQISLGLNDTILLMKEPFNVFVGAITFAPGLWMYADIAAYLQSQIRILMADPTAVTVSLGPNNKLSLVLGTGPALMLFGDNTTLRRGSLMWSLGFTSAVTVGIVDPNFEFTQIIGPLPGVPSFVPGSIDNRLLTVVGALSFGGITVMPPTVPLTAPSHAVFLRKAIPPTNNSFQFGQNGQAVFNTTAQPPFVVAGSTAIIQLGWTAPPINNFAYPFVAPSPPAYDAPLILPPDDQALKWMCVPYFNSLLLELLPMPTLPFTASAQALRSQLYRPLLPFGSPTIPTGPEGTNVFTDPVLPFLNVGTYAPQTGVTNDGSGRALYALDLSPHVAEAVQIPCGMRNATTVIPTTNPAQNARERLFVNEFITALQWSQELTAQSSWSVYTGLAVTSNSIPAFEELSGMNRLNQNGNDSTSASSNSVNILFDLDLGQDQLHQIQSGVTFAPNIFRYAQLKGGPLNSIDLQLLLRKKDGTFTPWIMDSGGTINVKLLFTKSPY